MSVTGLMLSSTPLIAVTDQHGSGPHRHLVARRDDSYLEATQLDERAVAVGLEDLRFRGE